MVHAAERSAPAARASGFTLVELLVVIAIIGVLTTVAVVALSDARRKSRDAKRAGDVRAIQTALALYYADSNGYPVEASPVELGVGDQRALCTGGWKAACDVGDTVYMGIVPAKPTPNDGGCSAADNQYMYETPVSGSYTVTFCLGGQFGEYAAGMHTASEDGIQ